MSYMPNRPICSVKVTEIAEVTNESGHYTEVLVEIVKLDRIVKEFGDDMTGAIRFHSDPKYQVGDILTLVWVAEDRPGVKG